MSVKNNEIKEKAKKAYDLAYKYEKTWGACSQCTIKALQDIYDEVNSDIFQALGGFVAGGACECDGMCGAYAAGIYFLGTKKGRRIEDIVGNRDDLTSKHQEQWRLVKKLHDRFIDKYGSVICSDIHRKIYGRSYYLADKKDLEKFNKAGAHDWGCTSVCGDAAKWSVEILEELFLNEKKSNN